MRTLQNRARLFRRLADPSSRTGAATLPTPLLSGASYWPVAPLLNAIGKIHQTLAILHPILSMEPPRFTDRGGNGEKSCGT